MKVSIKKLTLTSVIMIILGIIGATSNMFLNGSDFVTNSFGLMVIVPILVMLLVQIVSRSERDGGTALAVFAIISAAILGAALIGSIFFSIDRPGLSREEFWELHVVAMAKIRWTAVVIAAVLGIVYTVLKKYKKLITIID